MKQEDKRTKKAQCHPLASRRHLLHFLSDKIMVISLLLPKKWFPKNSMIPLASILLFCPLLPTSASMFFQMAQVSTPLEKSYLTSSFQVKCPSSMLPWISGYLSHSTHTTLLSCIYVSDFQTRRKFLEIKDHVLFIFAISSNYNSARHIYTASKEIHETRHLSLLWLMGQIQKSL